MKKVLCLLLVCVGVFWACAGMTAAPPKAKSVELYRYEDDNGVMVLSHSIPPELAHKGYTVLNPDGTVLRIVPREKTPKEVEESERKAKEEAAVAEASGARKHRDDELLKLYATAADVEAARDRKLRSIDGVIATTKANVVRLKQQKQHLEAQAADRERAGQLPSPEILQNLEILTTQIGDKEHEVEARELEKEQVSEQFQMDLDRVIELLPAPPVAPAPPVTQAAKPN